MIMMLFRIAQRVTKYLLGYFCKKSAAQKTAKMPNLVTLLRAYFLMPTIIILAHRQYAQLSLSLPKQTHELIQVPYVGSFTFSTLSIFLVSVNGCTKAFHLPAHSMDRFYNHVSLYLFALIQTMSSTALRTFIDSTVKLHLKSQSY